MKRAILFLLAVMMLSASAVSAQEKRVKYYGEVFLAGDVGFANLILEGERASENSILVPGVSLHTIHGAKFGESFSIGIGLGVDFLISTDDDEAGFGGFLIPLYVDFKYWIPTKGKVTPFIMADLGCSTLFYPQTIAPLYGAGIGFKVGKFMMSVGYMRDGFNLSSERVSLFNPELKFWEHKVQLRVGVSF